MSRAWQCIGVVLALGAAPVSAETISKAPSIPEALRACAVAEPDHDALRAQLEAGRYAEIEQTIEAIERGYAADARCEERIWNAFGTLRYSPAPLLDRWVTARAQSWSAVAARGGYWLKTGYERRGEARSRDVAQEAWRGMREAFARAETDLRRAQELRPQSFVPVTWSIWVWRAQGDAERVIEAHDAFVARDPLNFSVRWAALEALTPDWGGSMEALRHVADGSQAYAARNPRLLVLPGFVDWQVGIAAKRSGDLPAAVASYRRALAHDDVWAWYMSLANVLSDQKDWKGLEEASEAWTGRWPEDALAYGWQGRALLAQGKPEEALAALDAGIARHGQDGWMLSLRAQALEQLGKLPEALTALEAVLAAKPGDEWASQRIGTLRARIEATRQGPKRMPGLAYIGIESTPPAKGDDR